jgi:hypothetical protein
MLSYADIGYDYFINPEVVDCIEPQEVEPCRVLMQAFATQTLSFMAQHGSPVRLFCCKPSVMRSQNQHIAPDCNRHRLPAYTDIMSKVGNALGREDVVATPLVGAHLENLDDRALTDQT